MRIVKIALFGLLAGYAIAFILKEIGLADMRAGFIGGMIDVAVIFYCVERKLFCRK